MNIVLKKILPHLAAILGMLALAAIYFLPQLEGKVMQQSDLIQYKGMTQEILEVEEETGEKPLWTNSMFSGMPSFQINTPHLGNNLTYLEKALRLGIEHPIGRFFVIMLNFYILMLVLGVNRWLAFFGAIAFGFTTNHFTLYEAGHITKLRAISYFPLVAAGILLTYRKQYVWGGLLFAAGLGLNVLANHIQMSYYLALTIPFFVIAELIRDIKRERLTHFIKASAILIVGAGLAVGASLSNIWSTYDYSKETMRGEPILAPEGDQPRAQGVSSSETEGLAWDYAMQWSNGLIDLFASFVPGAAGGGSSEALQESYATYQDLRRKGVADPGQFPSPLYWGALPFTSGPIYFGAVIFFLFIAGLLLVKGPVKWWVGLGVLLTFMLSMGKNLAWFNEFFYYYVPMYNKFRTPNSVLAIASFLIPMLGVLSLHQVLSGKVSAKEVIRAVTISGGIVGGLSFILFLLGPSLFGFSSPGDVQLEQSGWSLDAIIEDRQGLMRRDALRSFLLVAIAAGLLWGFVQNKIKQGYFLAGLTLLIIFDLWMIDRRYVNYDSFTNRQSTESFFQPRPVDQQIMQDPDPHYRVFDLTVNTFNSAQYSYYHKMIGGYHAAKLQRYQDLIDRHLSQGNRTVLNMLNTRYIITQGQDGQAIAQRNPGALDNAWYVDAFRMVSTPNEEINALNNFRPDSVAVVHEEFSDYIQGLDPARNGSIELTNYLPDHLTYQANAPQETFAVFSEIWYGPDKGWQAYIDGEPVEHIRVNYALRGLRIPAGRHEVEFIFKPKSFFTGRTISRIVSSIILLGLLGYTGYSGYRQVLVWREEEEQSKQKPKKQAGKKKKKGGRRRKA